MSLSCILAGVNCPCLYYQATGSLGEEGHFYVRSDSRRLHYTGPSNLFMVRSQSQNAGFDEEGKLRIF